MYIEAADALGVPVESRTIQTPYGATHVLVTGAPDAPAAVVFQGGNFLNPYSLAWILPALTRFRVYAPDTVGHPGFSSQHRLSARDHSYGHWASAVLSALRLNAATIIGTSYGGGIALRLSEIAPGRVERLILHVPAGIATAPLIKIAAIGLPMLLYRFKPDRERLIRLAKPLWGNAPDAVGLRILDAMLRHVRLEAALPRLAGPKALNGLKCPVLVLAAARDVLFPAGLVLREARRLMPLLVKTVELEGSHVPSLSDLVRLQACVRQFCES